MCLAATRKSQLNCNFDYGLFKLRSGQWYSQKVTSTLQLCTKLIPKERVLGEINLSRTLFPRIFNSCEYEAYLFELTNDCYEVDANFEQKKQSHGNS